ncbi:MAG TPA: AraC family transcriptional regulator, partial [Thalassospira sp.]|nr:AraC family transcriptional regulator [Thalassospira sp.]
MSLIANADLNSPSNHLEGQFNPAGHDMVNELLSGVRLRGLDYRRIEISAPFGLRFGEDVDDGRAWFHFI